MLRYVCENPNCLNTFLSPDLDIFKKCELCGEHLIHVGKPQRDGDDKPYPPLGETKEDLKAKYVKARKHALSFGMTDDECLTVGRAVRKLSYEERKQALQENGLWQEDIIYKHVKSKEGLWKMVIDWSAMSYRKRKMRNKNE